MLVQMTFSEVMARTQMYQGHALCSKCGTPVGPLSRDELQAMMSGKYGDVLCFSCEDFPPQPFRLINIEIWKKLKDLFKVENPDDLPINAWPYWSNGRKDVTLQLSQNFGWCLWLLSPDEGQWQLRRVKMNYKEAKTYKETFLMFPVEI